MMIGTAVFRVIRRSRNLSAFHKQIISSGKGSCNPQVFQRPPDHIGLVLNVHLLLRTEEGIVQIAQIMIDRTAA